MFRLISSLITIAFASGLLVGCNSSMPPRHLIEGYPTGTFQNRSMIFLPMQKIKLDTNGNSKSLNSILLGADTEKIGYIISEKLFSEMKSKIFKTTLTYGDSLSQTEGLLSEKKSYIGWGTVSTDTILENFSGLNSDILKSIGILPDMVLTFSHMALSIERHADLEELCLKGNYMIWDYRINQAVVMGRIETQSRSIGNMRYLYHKNLDRVVEQAIFQILFATPFYES